MRPGALSCLTTGPCFQAELLKLHDPSSPQPSWEREANFFLVNSFWVIQGARYMRTQIPCVLRKVRSITIKDGMVGGKSKLPELESRLCLSSPILAVLYVLSNKGKKGE